MGKHKVLTAHQVEWAYYWWKKGYTMGELADALFVSRPTIWRAIEGKRQEKQIWSKEKPPLKYDKNWRAEDGQA